MEIGKQIQQRRAAAGMSQEELAERLYVTRQTLSNWETGKTYPDINSLLRMSELFQVSLDEMVKGDLQTMEEKIKQEDIAKFRRENNILKGALAACGLSCLVWLLWNKNVGEVLCMISVMTAILWGYRVDMLQRKYDILTYREVKAFLEGKRLDELEIQEVRKTYPKKIWELVLIITFLGILAAIIVPRIV